jgi:cysteine synthase A
MRSWWAVARLNNEQATVRRQPAIRLGKYFDQRLPIAGAEGVKWAKALAQKEGIFTGISGGATFAVALQVAEKAAPGSVVLCMLPDTGERYLTTPLFDGIAEDMDEAERAISKSTPGYQMP